MLPFKLVYFIVKLPIWIVFKLVLFVRVVLFTFIKLRHWSFRHKKRFILNIFFHTPKAIVINRWLLFRKYLRTFKISYYFRYVFSRIKYYCIKTTKTVKAIFMWYDEYKYTIIQKLIYGACWVIWLGGFTYGLHDNINLFVPFVEAYLTNSFIYNIGVYSFKIKNITLFQTFRGFLFVSIWHYIDYAVCLPILKWVVYVLDKKVDYESMGWVYKLEAYLDSKGWIPRHPWSTYTKKKNIRQWDFFLDQQRLERIENFRNFEKTVYDNAFFGLGKWLDLKAKFRDSLDNSLRKDEYNQDIREHHQFLYQEKLFAQGMDIIEAKQKAKEKFMNDKTDYWEEELNATRIHPKHSQYFRPNMDIKRETSLEIQRLINEEEERKRKLDPNDPEYLDNLLKELSALRQKQQELAETKQKYQDKRDKKNTKFKGKWRTKKQQKNYELIKFVDQANMDYIEARDSKII